MLTDANAEASPLEPDMKGIRRIKSDKFVVRVSAGGVQQHVGTFESYAGALEGRDRAAQRRAAPAPRGGIGKAAPGAQPLQLMLAEPAPSSKVKGVYERSTAGGTVYDVLAYTKGCYSWGGRYRTREGAEEARALMTLTPRQTTLADAALGTGERGISVRWNKGRRGAAAPGQPVYIARSYARGGKHLGTHTTVEGAREAIDSYDKSGNEP